MMEPKNNQISYTPLSFEDNNLNYPLGPNTMLSSSCVTPDTKSFKSTLDQRTPCKSSEKSLNNSNDHGSSMLASPIFYSPTTANLFNESVTRTPSYYTNHGMAPVSSNQSYYTHSTEKSPAKTPKVDKNSKGLRHFSMKVLQKVQAKGITTYNEVADELVKEFGTKTTPEQQSYDHKNIRRRVYDALNVLMAMNIIHKEKKEIKWVGLPSNSVQEVQQLEKQRDHLLATIKQKLKKMRDSIIQEISLRNLVAHNEELEKNTLELEESKYRMELPFIAVTTAKNSKVECSVTVQKDDYYLGFESPFEIYDETEIMKRLGYSNDLETGACSVENIEKCKSILPASLHPYVDVIGCCKDDEFEDLILSHRNYLTSEQSVNTEQNIDDSLFVAKLSESCNNKKINIQNNTML
ncbi:hypothetical protein HZS_2642, partial [Henneguya salminicola]